MSDAIAAQRLSEVGRNELAPPRGPAPWMLLLGQFASPLVWLLLAACVVSALLGDLPDGLTIAAILVLNAAGSVLAQLLLTTSSLGQHLFHLARVPKGLLAAAGLVALVPVTGLETIKLVRAALARRRARHLGGGGTTNTGRPA